MAEKRSTDSQSQKSKKSTKQRTQETLNAVEMMLELNQERIRLYKEKLELEKTLLEYDSDSQDLGSEDENPNYGPLTSTTTRAMGGQEKSWRPWEEPQQTSGKSTGQRISHQENPGHIVSIDNTFPISREKPVYNTGTIPKRANTTLFGRHPYENLNAPSPIPNVRNVASPTHTQPAGGAVLPTFVQHESGSVFPNPTQNVKDYGLKPSQHRREQVLLDTAQHDEQLGLPNYLQRRREPTSSVPLQQRETRLPTHLQRPSSQPGLPSLPYSNELGLPSINASNQVLLRPVSDANNYPVLPTFVQHESDGSVLPNP